MVCKVALSNASYSYDVQYSYSISNELESKIKVGCRVLVPFGKGNRKRIALVTRIYFKEEFDPALKPVLEVIDKDASVSEEMMKIIFWLKENTFSTFFEAFRTVIPTGLGVDFNIKYEIVKNPDLSQLLPEEGGFYDLLKACTTLKELGKFLDFSENPHKKEIVESLVKKGALKEQNIFKRKIGDETIKMVRLSDVFLSSEKSVKLTEKQQGAVQLLEECNCASIKELSYLCGVTSSVILGLVKKQVLVQYDYETLRSPWKTQETKANLEDIKLSDIQKNAYNGIKAMLDEHKAAGALLYGITGSGKTSIFVKLIDYTLKQGRAAIVLVPEISLTPQTVFKFRSLFGKTVAVIHSNLSVGQRVDEYKRIRSGDAKIVIGTRSAIFAPIENIGIIIMDEEGERTYKSESSPRYHARDVAIQRCGYHNAILLLASATPSIESYFYAKIGRFKLFELGERYSNASLPQVVIVDMQLEVGNGNNGIFSRELVKQIKQNIEKKEQTILLLNRRGYHTYISCLDCRKPLVCPNCNIPLTYHKKNGQLMCHYCGYQRQLDKVCPECKSTHLYPTGVGTQKLEDEIIQYFPEARVLRMDADTTYSKYSYEKNFKDFGDGKYDIMVGTQMIAKGLDFPNVTLVGVLSLDKALFTGDYKSYERTFSLITQVVGRSGRGKKSGCAFIQTCVPEHYVLNLAAKQDYKSFYEEEIAIRKVLVYPPFCDICVVGMSSLVEKDVAIACDEFINLMKKKIEEENLQIPLRVLGPSKCTFQKINNKFRYRIIIKCKNTKVFRDFMSGILKSISKNKKFTNIILYADINGDIGL